MSSKRSASNDLNHENWADEEEPEERGEFRTAPEEELSKRVIKRARRRITGTSGETAETVDGGSASSSGSKNIFSTFKGFGGNSTNPLSSTGTAGAFSFLSKIPTVAASATSGTSAANTEVKASGTTMSFSQPATTASTFSFGQPSTSAQSPKINFPFGDLPLPKTSEKQNEKPCFSPLTTPNKSAISSLQKSVNYCAKLKVLNQNVRDWIKIKVDQNPICLLTPIFKDYEQYLSELDKEDKSYTDSNKSQESSTTDSSPKTTIPKITFGAPSGNTTSTPFTSGASLFGGITNSSTEGKTNGFSFGNKSTVDQTPTTSTANKTSGFNFGFTKPPDTPLTGTDGGAGDDKKVGFSFATGTAPFTFGNIKPLAPEPEKDKAGDDDDDEEELPKEEIKQVVEKDAVYSKKCKVYVKHDDSYGDRGVGTLYLKPVPDSNKTQLIVRADTNLGNILLNFILNGTIPAKRSGKNNVLLVCIPTPDDKKPTPVLVRVKTAEEADELLETIDKYKK